MFISLKCKTFMNEKRGRKVNESNFIEVKFE